MQMATMFAKYERIPNLLGLVLVVVGIQQVLNVKALKNTNIVEC